jgi:2-keto-4-pentenoate hydratase
MSTTASLFADMRFNKRVIAELPPNARPNALGEAYESQRALVEQLTARYGGGPVGYKVACTSQLAREQLNVPHPLFGTLLSHSTHASPATLSAASFTRRTIEPEFGFQLAQDVPPSSREYRAETIAPFIGALFPSIEIVDHRFVDWSAIGAFGIAADNAIHGAWIHGAPFADWRALDLQAHAVRLYADGLLVREGTGAAVLDGPLSVMAWLANTLPAYGRALRKGDFVTTGVVCDVYPAEAGQTLRADFGLLGEATVRFTA